MYCSTSPRPIHGAFGCAPRFTCNTSPAGTSSPRIQYRTGSPRSRVAVTHSAGTHDHVRGHPVNGSRDVT